MSPARYSLCQMALGLLATSQPKRLTLGSFQTAWKVASQPFGVLMGGAAGPILELQKGTFSRPRTSCDSPQ